MAEIKTKQTAVDPREFVKRLDNEQKRKDAEELIRMMSKATGKPPKMWGPTIVGFGKYHYKYTSGRDGEMCMAGFSPRKPSLVVYLGYAMDQKDLLSRLGKHKTGKGCLYINKLDDVNRSVLNELIVKSVAEMRRRYDCD